MNKEAWQEEAYSALRRWARYHHIIGQQAWTAERIRGLLYTNALANPPKDDRSWGPVFQKAIADKIIRRKGYAPAKSSHNAIKATYVGTKYA